MLLQWVVRAPAAGIVAFFIAALSAFVEVAQSWHLPSQVAVSPLAAAGERTCCAASQQTLSSATLRRVPSPAAACHLDIWAMPLSHERALEIRDDCFADDVPLPPDTCRWGAEELEQYLRTGGKWLPAWRAAPLKMLCLHGGGVNSKVMEYQAGNLRRALGGETHFEYLNGPREWADQVDPRLLRFFDEGPYYGWYGVSDDADPSRAHMDKLLDETVTFTYDKVEEGLDWVEDKIRASGPFDAIMGFSQGSIVATMLTARAMARYAAGDGPGPTWRHVMLFSGMPPRDSRFLRRLQGPLAFPCTLVFGRRDEFFDYGQRLRTLYSAPTVFDHAEGHKFPSDPQVNQAIAAHVQQHVRGSTPQ